MNVEPLFTVAVLLALAACFAISAASLRRRGFAIGCAFIEGVSTDGPRPREMGRREVYLLCLDDLLPCGKHSTQWRLIIQ